MRIRRPRAHVPTRASAHCTRRIVLLHILAFRRAVQNRTLHFCFLPRSVGGKLVYTFCFLLIPTKPSAIRRKSRGRSSGGKNTVKIFAGVVKQRNLLRTGCSGYSRFGKCMAAHMAVVQLRRITRTRSPADQATATFASNQAPLSYKNGVS